MNKQKFVEYVEALQALYESTGLIVEGEEQMVAAIDTNSYFRGALAFDEVTCRYRYAIWNDSLKRYDWEDY